MLKSMSLSLILNLSLFSLAMEDTVWQGPDKVLLYLKEQLEQPLEQSLTLDSISDIPDEYRVEFLTLIFRREYELGPDFELEETKWRADYKRSLEEVLDYSQPRVSFPRCTCAPSCLQFPQCAEYQKEIMEGTWFGKYLACTTKYPVNKEKLNKR